MLLLRVLRVPRRRHQLPLLRELRHSRSSRSSCQQCRRLLLQHLPTSRRLRKIIYQPLPRPVPLCHHRRPSVRRKPREEETLGEQEEPEEEEQGQEEEEVDHLPLDRQKRRPRASLRQPSRHRIATSAWATREKIGRPAGRRNWSRAATAAVQVSQRKRSSASIPGERIIIKRFGVSPYDDDDDGGDVTNDSNDEDDDNHVVAYYPL